MHPGNKKKKENEDRIATAKREDRGRAYLQQNQKLYLILIGNDGTLSLFAVGCPGD